MDKSRLIVYGLTAVFAAATYGFMADLGEAPDGGLLARHQNVQVLEGIDGFLHNGAYEKNDIILTLPLDWEITKQETGLLPFASYFNMTGQEERPPPGMYRITTRGNLFPLLNLGPAMIIKADPLI